MFRFVTLPNVVCLGYCLINEKGEITLRSCEFLTIMLVRKKNLGDEFSHIQESSKPKKINVF